MSEPTQLASHDLLIRLGDCELYGDCTCGHPLGFITVADSLDTLGSRWEIHVMEVRRG